MIYNRVRVAACAFLLVCVPLLVLERVHVHVPLLVRAFFFFSLFSSFFPCSNFFRIFLVCSIQELHLGRPGCSAEVFWLLLEHLSSISHDKLITIIDFRIFGLVLGSSGLTMDDSLLSLDVLCTTWLVFGLS